VKMFFPLVVLHWLALMPVAQAQRNNAAADLMRPPCFLLDDPHCNELPAPSKADRFMGFLVLYISFLSLIAWALPRPWFLWSFRTLFPFMPESIQDDGNEKET
jgi:hypothetical protein